MLDRISALLPSLPAERRDHRMRSVHAAFAVAMALCAISCAGANDHQLGRRASFDLACPEPKLEIVILDDRTRGVRGCGKQATYVENCDAPPGAMGRSCTWVLNTDPGAK